MNELIETVVRNAERGHVPAPEDTVRDGLLICGKCGTPRQTRLPFPLSGRTVVPCLCRCREEAWEKEEAARRAREEALRAGRLRDAGIRDPLFRSSRFETADGRNGAVLAKLARYADRFDEAARENIGLFLYGGPGSGKTFAAACVANRLIDRGTPVLMTSLPRVIAAIGGFRADRNALLRELAGYPLLILDDFGVERATEYVSELIYQVIDARYRAGKPLILTSNLPWSGISSPADLTRERVYDRIRELCQPVNFGGGGRRRAIAGRKKQAARALLNEAE